MKKGTKKFLFLSVATLAGVYRTQSFSGRADFFI